MLHHKRTARLRGMSLLAIATASLVGPARAETFDFDNPDFKLRWDNTVKYSTAIRVDEPSSALLGDANLDDGDRDFKPGFVSDRFDLFSELDADYKNFGIRVSGAAWYDSIYNMPNDNNSPKTSNHYTASYNSFDKSTRDTLGRKAEFLDAFAHAQLHVGDMPLTIRIGRHSLLYGESLFFGANGIANAQQPVDFVKLLSVPNSQFKEILRPVNQVSGVLQVTSHFSISAYYQLEWEASRLEPSGGYLSDTDFVGDGAQKFIVGLPPGGPALAFFRKDDIKAPSTGQGGVALHYRTANDIEFGLYAARYNDKTPQIYLEPDGGPPAPNGRLGSYTLVYPKGIETYGASVSTVVGPVNVAGEVSGRVNAPLVSDPVLILPGEAADNGSNARYALGDTLHAQASAIYVLESSRFWDGGSTLGEIAWNDTLAVTANPRALDPNTTREALAFRGLFIPTYFQVFPATDISVPIGLGYNPVGRSSAVFKFNGGTEGGGDLSIGLAAVYRQVWNAGLNFTHYFGRDKPFLSQPNSLNIPTAPPPVISFGQSLIDRDFVSFNITRTF